MIRIKKKNHNLLYYVPDSQKMLSDLVCEFDDSLSKLETKCPNHLTKLLFFQFCIYADEVEQNIKISKIQLPTPINHSMRIFCAFAFSAYSTHLNVKF